MRLLVYHLIAVLDSRSEDQMMEAFGLHGVMLSGLNRVGVH